MTQKIKYSFEDLNVWRDSVELVKLVNEFTEEISKSRSHYRLIQQLEAAVASVPANIAEGKGRFSKKEFIQFLYIARGSLFETITFLAVFKEMNLIDENRLDLLRAKGDEIGKKLSSLITSLKKSLS